MVISYKKGGQMAGLIHILCSRVVVFLILFYDWLNIT